MKQELKKIMELEKEHHLALWCMEQAKLYYDGKLSKDKIKKLKAIKFPFGYYMAMYDRENMTFEEFEKDKSIDEMMYTLQRWVIKSKGKSIWKTEITKPLTELEKVEGYVKQNPKAVFRLLDDDFEVIALKCGNDKKLNFKKR
jgi:hypothetical protein